MKKFLFLISIIFYINGFAQTPVHMALQPALTYIENFDSILSWTNNFASGAGAEHFSSVATGGTNPIPNPTRITTSSAAWVIGSAGGLQKDSINNRLMMLVTGTSNNTSSLAFDFFMDFTGINAGTLSFDWETVFNGATNSNRNATLKVYSSVDGINFTEIPAASITITNYVAAGGSIANVSLPASFNNAPNAQLRFYYYNASGGTTGSRPLIALDNIKVTASGSPCVMPTASATSLVFNNITATTVQGSFTPAVVTPDEYLVIATSMGSLTSNPADSFVFNVGDNVGDGVVIYGGANTNFLATNLNPQTTYTFYIFSVNIYCNGTIRYRTIDPLTDTVTTPAGPPCIAPVLQPSNLIFDNITTNSISGVFTGVPDASEYLVVRSLNATLTANPTDGTQYNAGDILGSDIVVYRGGATNFTATGLSHSALYHFFIFSLNNYACSFGPAYNTISPLSAQQSTKVLLPCTTPSGIASNLNFNTGSNYIHGSFNPYPDATNSYLVVMGTSSSLNALPQDGINYSIGSNLGGGTIISNQSNYSFSAMSLATNTTYYFFIFSYNDICIDGPLYRTSSFLFGSAATSNTPAYNFYFGNLHAHSSYSDGNKDNSALTPSDDYAYAKNAMCMDFLGISEHNHFTSNDNPGMLLSYYQQGLSQAASFTSANPNFLALYGMEWGTLTNGGHVLVYGVDSLLGWETLNGNHNYNIFVTKNDYLSDSGLFKTVLDFTATNSFATLAHPSWTDFQNIVNIPLNTRADSAITGIAVESGPAFSTNTNYSEPGGNMSFLPYYQQMLARGYHAAPMIDHDNHNTTFGRTAYTRTAVIAPSIAKNDFMQAMNNMRFYATQDCDTRAEILVYGQQMGSEFTHSFAPAITITANDPTNTTAIPTINLMMGVPGSGVTASLLKTTQGNVLNYTDFTLQDSSTAYYYADITIAGKRTITAPIWYSRIDTGLIINGIPTVKNDPKNNVLIKTNPAKEKLNIELIITKPTLVQLSVYNMLGQKFITQHLKLYSGIQSLSIPLEALPTGFYILEANFGTERIARRFSHL